MLSFSVLHLPFSLVLHNPPPSTFYALPILLCGLLNLLYRAFKPKPKPDNLPPVIHLSDHEIFDTPRHSYESALKHHGPVIGVKRKGILEYIVSKELTRQVLCEDSIFSFERGVTFTLNINFMQRLSHGTFFKSVDSLVYEGITQRLDTIIPNVYPVFYQNVLSSLHTNPNVPPNPLDMFELAHRTVSEAMILLIFGKEHFTPDIQKVVIATASGFAAMSGLTNNGSYLARHWPFLERSIARTKYIASVGIPFAFTLLPIIWSELAKIDATKPRSSEKKADEEEILLSILGRYFADSKTGKVGWYSRILVTLIVVMLIFASVHQTASVMVWVVFELASRKEYIPQLREEANALLEPSTSLAGTPTVTVTYDALKRARYLDSFIREVMRTKGDTLNHIRVTTRDASLAGYTIPRGSPVLPLTSLTHSCTTYHGPDASSFDGFRYVNTHNPPIVAAMTGPGYIPFGLSRWACPGRFFAVSEIKMMLLSMLVLSEPELVGGNYRVVDKLNITSVPPEGELVLNAL